MIFSKVSGEDVYKAAFEKFKSEYESVQNAVLEYSKGRFFTQVSAWDMYNAQRINALKQRPSRAYHLKTIEPLKFLIKVASLKNDDWISYEGLEQDYGDFEIELPDFFPVKCSVNLHGENITSTMCPEGDRSGSMTLTWWLDKHNGGLVEIVDPSLIDLTAAAAEDTRIRLAAERREILKVR